MDIEHELIRLLYSKNIFEKECEIEDNDGNVKIEKFISLNNFLNYKNWDLKRVILDNIEITNAIDLAKANIIFVYDKGIIIHRMHVDL